MSRMFGTDGVRGVAGMELTIELAMKLGQAGAYALTKEKEHQPTIIVGCDTRISGGMLANALMAGICSVGANAIYAGIVPTPAIAYLTRKHKVDAGVVISASHNLIAVYDIPHLVNCHHAVSISVKRNADVCFFINDARPKFRHMR